MKILKNPYILVGLFGLGYFWYKRKQILANEDGSQDKLRKLYEKLYQGEKYVP